MKLLSALIFLPIVLLLGLFLFTEENIALLQKVFTQDMTNDEIQMHLAGLGFRGQVTVSILSMLQIVIAVLPAEPVQVPYGQGTGSATYAYGPAGGDAPSRSMPFIDEDARALEQAAEAATEQQAAAEAPATEA